MNKIQNFVIWLDGFIEAVGDNMNISKTNLIKNKLNSLFEHDAEKVEEPETQTYPSMDYDMRNINGVPPSNDDDVLIRC
jgi:hypothetical protein